MNGLIPPRHFQVPLLRYILIRNFTILFPSQWTWNTFMSPQKNNDDVMLITCEETENLVWSRELYVSLTGGVRDTDVELDLMVMSRIGLDLTLQMNFTDLCNGQKWLKRRRRNNQNNHNVVQTRYSRENNVAFRLWKSSLH